MHEELPDKLVEAISKVIHHNSKDEDALVKDILNLIKTKFFEGEKVILQSTSNGTNSNGIIITGENNGAPSNKENLPKYSVRMEDDLIQEDVSFTSLSRCQSFAEYEIKNLISTMAERVSKSAPWKLKDEYRQKFQVKDKIFPLFASKNINSPLTPNADRAPKRFYAGTPKTSDQNVVEPSQTDDSIDNARKSGSWVSKVEIEPMPNIDDMIKKKQVKQLRAISSDDEQTGGNSIKNKKSRKSNASQISLSKSLGRTKKEKQDKSIDGTKKRKRKIEQLSDGKAKKMKRKLEQSVDKKEKKDRVSDLVERSIEKSVKSVQVKSNQKTLTSFFQPSANGASTAASPGQLEKAKAMQVFETARRHIRSLDGSAFEKFLDKNCELPNDIIKRVESKFLRYLLRRQSQVKKDKQSTKNMSVEERRDYTKDRKGSENTTYEEILRKFMESKFEDTAIPTEPLPDLPLIVHEMLRDIPLNEMPKYQQIFSSCLEISEFLQLFQGYLGIERLFSAAELYRSLFAEERGYFNTIGPVIENILHVLLQEGIGSRITFNDRPLSFFTINVGSSLEIIKLVMEEAIKLEDEKHYSHIFSQDVDEKMLKVMLEISAKPLYELDPESKTNLLLFLIYEIQALESWQEYIPGCRNEISNDKSNIKEIEAKILGLKLQLKELPPLKTDEEIATLMLTRDETRNIAKNEKNRTAWTTEFQELKNNLKELQNGLEIKRRLYEDRIRIQPLGTDRYHRRYWYFYKSLNSGIFVEQGWCNEDYSFELKNRDNEEDSDMFDEELNNDVIIKMMRKYVAVSSGPDPKLPVEWRHLSGTKEDISKWVENLSQKGIRESNLRKKLVEALKEMADSTIEQSTPNKDEFYGGPTKELKEQIAELYERLLEGLFLQPDENSEFMTSLEMASTLIEFVNLLEYLSNLTRPIAFKKSEPPFDKDEWIQFVRSCPNFSQMLLWIEIFVDYIDFENSMANWKCKTCRKGATLQNPLLKCHLCSLIVHAFCTRPKVFDQPIGDWACKVCSKMDDDERRRKEWEKEEEEFERMLLEHEREPPSNKAGCRGGRAVVEVFESEEEQEEIEDEDDGDELNEEENRPSRYTTRSRAQRMNREVPKEEVYTSHLRSHANKP